MLSDLNIVGGTVVFTDRTAAAGISIKNGKLVAVSDKESLPSACETLEADGCIILPGMVDAHVHVRAPSFSQREDFESGTAAAVSGGITTIVEMPISSPPTSDPEMVMKRVKNASEHAYTDFAFYAGAGASNLDKISELAKCGIVGFKTFLMPPPEGREKEFYGLCSVDDRSLEQVLTRVQETGLILAIHAEDKDIIQRETLKVQASGAIDLAAFSSSRPPDSETQAVSRVIRAQQGSRDRVLICHASLPQTIESIVKARSSGTDIYCETCPHYLFLCQENVEVFGPYARVKPPIRKEAYRKELLKCFTEGIIDIISSDHAPYLPSEKEHGQSNIWEAPDGIPGLELSLPLLLNKVSEGTISYGDIVRVFSEKPAKLLGLYPLKGSLEEGSDADIVIVKPGVIKKNKMKNLFSKSRFSGKVYEGWEWSHSIEKTLCRGEIVFENGHVVGRPGYGEYVGPKN